jgi:methyl-accepting chemotaxis protein
MSLANTKVSTKLYVGFSIPVVLMGVLIWVSLSNMATIENNLERIVTVNNVRGDLANDAAQKVRMISTDIREIFLAKEDKQREGIKKEIAESREKYSEEMKKVEEMTAKDDAKAHDRHAPAAARWRDQHRLR